MKRFIIVLTALLVVACGGGDKVKLDRADVAPKPLADFVTTVGLERIWSRNVGANFDKRFLNLSPALDNGVVYIANSGGRIVATDIDTGARLWAADLDATLTAGVGHGPNTLIVALGDGKVAALARESGELTWTQRVGGQVLARPIVERGIVIVRTVDGKLIGLQESDGAVRWQLRREVPGLSLRGDPEPVIYGDLVITGFASGKLLASELESGKVIWEVNAANPRGRNEIERLIDVDARPILVGSVLYVAAYQGQLTALATGSRRVLWTLELSSYRDIEADADNIYVVDGDDTITAVNRLTGRTVWQQDGLQRRRVTAPLTFSDFVVVADAEGYMHVLDRQTGMFAGRIRIGSDGVRVTPIEIDGRVYVVSMDGSLTSIEIQ